MRKCQFSIFAVILIILFAFLPSSSWAAPFRLDGLWRVGPSVWRMQARGDSIQAVYASHDRDDYSLFQPGEKMLDVRQQGFTLSGKVRARFAGAAGEGCPDVRDRWEGITLAISEDGQTLSGAWESMELDPSTCRLSGPVSKLVTFRRLTSDYQLTIRTEKAENDIDLGERFQAQILFYDPPPEPQSVMLIAPQKTLDVLASRVTQDDGQISSPYVFRSKEIYGDEMKRDETTLALFPGDSIKATYGNKIDTKAVSGLALTEVHILGFHEEEPQPPDICNPALPRFFISDGGHPSVDLDWKELQRSRTVELSFVQNEEKEFPHVLNTSLLEPHPASEGRWATVDIFKLYSEKWDYSEHDTYQYLLKNWTRFSFAVRILSQDGFEHVYLSPPAEKFEVLRWMRTRVEYLSKKLFEVSFDDAPTKESEREYRAWLTFLRSQTIRARVHVENRGKEAALSQMAYVYALFEPGWNQKWKNLSEFPLASGQVLKPGESDITLTSDLFHPQRWEIDELKALRGLQIVFGENREAKVESGFKGFSSIIAPFSIHPFDPRRTASLLISVELEEPRFEANVLRAVNNFLLETAPPTSDSQIPWKTAQNAAREWKELITQFEELTKLRVNAFGREDYGKLHDLMTGELLDSRVIIGLSGESRDNLLPLPQPGDALPGARSADLLFVDKFELSLPQPIIAAGGIIAIGTGGLSAGGIEVNERIAEMHQRYLKNREMRLPHSTTRWLPPRGYVDAFLHLSEEEMKAVVSSLGDGRPFSAIKGDLAEAFTARQYGRGRADVLTDEGKTSLYIPGWSVRHYKGDTTGRITGGKGSLMTDGLILSVEGDKIRVHEILEVKSGQAGMEGAEAQLEKHWRRIDRDGIAIVKPTEEEVHFFQRLGIEPQTRKISGVSQQVIYVAKSRMNLPAKGTPGLLTAVGPANVECRGPRGEVRLSLQQDQIEDLADELMFRAGRDPSRWENPYFSLRGYRDYYKELPNRERRLLSETEVVNRFIRGERYDPETGQWKNIFIGPLALSNPYLGVEEFIDAYERVRGERGAQNIDREMAERLFYKGQRYNPETNRWYRPPFLIDPKDPTLTPEERFLLWKRMTKSARITDDRARELIQEGHIFDWTGEQRRWKAPTEWTANDPSISAQSSTRRRFFRSAEMQDFYIDLINLAEIGFFETQRLANQALRVMVYKSPVPVPPLTVIQVLRKSVAQDGSESWEYAGSPAMQKILLIDFFLKSEGFWSSGGVPLWLSKAELLGG